VLKHAGAKSHLVCAGRHDPVAVFADAHALAGLLKVKVLQQLYTVGELGVVLQTPSKALAYVASLAWILRTVSACELAILAADGLHCR
jgi:hypothetical protein